MVVAGFAPCFGPKKSRENEIIATIRLESDYRAENSFIFALFLLALFLTLTLAPGPPLKKKSPKMSKNKKQNALQHCYRVCGRSENKAEIWPRYCGLVFAAASA